jgi:hypothetical protein
MALRLGRGLFRLWLVLSVLWIGGVAATTWWTLPVDLCATPPGGLHDCDANDLIRAGLSWWKKKPICARSLILPNHIEYLLMTCDEQKSSLARQQRF